MSAVSIKETVADLAATFKSTGRLVIAGASLAGLRAAEALRKEGFAGPLTIIGDEPEEPYDYDVETLIAQGEARGRARRVGRPLTRCAIRS